MWCGILTLSPAMINAICDQGLIARAIKKKILSVKTWNVRDYAQDKHASVDDRPYGGGAGMVMMAPPIFEALKAAKSESPAAPRVIYVTPAGKIFNQSQARRLAQERQPLIFIAGRYEGVDQRIIETVVDEQFSIGDYVLSGGELAIMVIIDALTRWLPGAVGHKNSVIQDAFSEENSGLLDYPHYTRPSIWKGKKVPSPLMEGNHKEIEHWRKKQALRQTFLYRKDLLQNLTLDKESQAFLAEFEHEYNHHSK
jgi:tRNA (guanine37-N1)-methyltransferase